MKETKLFVCEACGTTYKDKNKCMECEKNHVKPVKIVGKKFVSLGDNRKGYPVHISVLMEDGVSLTYKRKCL